MKTPQSIDLILTEKNHAEEKFPGWPTDPLHAVAVLGEEYGELVRAVLQLCYEPHKTTIDEVRAEAIQTAAMAIRFAEGLEHYVFRDGPQHLQDGSFLE